MNINYTYPPKKDRNHKTKIGMKLLLRSSGAYIVLVKVFVRKLSKEMICLHNAPVPISALARA
jgi:hypothetical protein